MKNLKLDKLSQLDGGSFILIPYGDCPLDWVAIATTHSLSFRPAGPSLCSKGSPLG